MLLRREGLNGIIELWSTTQDTENVQNILEAQKSKTNRNTYFPSMNVLLYRNMPNPYFP